MTEKKLTPTEKAIATTNAIRNDSSARFQGIVPYANENNIGDVWNAIKDRSPILNEFVDGMLEKVGKTTVVTKSLTNKLGRFKKENMDLGRYVEQTWVDIIEGEKFDPELAETKIFARNKPKVKVLYHQTTRDEIYPFTIEYQEMQTAFTSWNTLNSFYSSIFQAMENSNAVAEFNYTKGLMNSFIGDEEVACVKLHIPKPNDTNAREIMKLIKSVSNLLSFPSRQYNTLGVMNQDEKDKQYLFSTSVFDAFMDVDVLAKAFNKSHTEFSGQNVLLDNFGRKGETYGKDNLQMFTHDTSAVCAITTEEFFVIHNQLTMVTVDQNGRGRYQNYTYHKKDIFSACQFANFIAFVTDENEATHTLSDEGVLKEIVKG